VPREHSGEMNPRKAQRAFTQECTRPLVAFWSAMSPADQLFPDAFLPALLLLLGPALALTFGPGAEEGARIAVSSV